MTTGVNDRDREETASEVSVDRDAPSGVGPKNVQMKFEEKNDYDELDIKDPHADDDSYDPSQKKDVDRDAQGREKIRVNIGGGARRQLEKILNMSTLKKCKKNGFEKA